MIFWFKSFNQEEHGRSFSIGQVNTYPLGQNVMQVITSALHLLLPPPFLLFRLNTLILTSAALIWAWWSDAVELRWPPMLLAGVRIHCTLKHSRCSQSTADMEYVRRHRTRCNACVYAYRAAMGVVLYGTSAGAIVLD